MNCHLTKLISIIMEHFVKYFNAQILFYTIYCCIIYLFSTWLQLFFISTPCYGRKTIYFWTFDLLANILHLISCKWKYFISHWFKWLYKAKITRTPPTHTYTHTTSHLSFCLYTWIALWRRGIVQPIMHYGL